MLENTSDTRTVFPIETMAPKEQHQQQKTIEIIDYSSSTDTSSDKEEVSTASTSTTNSHDDHPVIEPPTEENERKSKFYPKVFRAMQIKPAFPKHGRGRWTNVASYRVRVPDGPLAQVFYPCAKMGHAARKKYAGKYMRNDAAAGLAAFITLPPVIFSPLINKRHHVLNQAPPHPQLVHRAAGKVPVIIFSHGLAGNADMYSITCKDLASQGYVVWAIEHEDASASFARTESGALVAHDTHTFHKTWRSAAGEEFDADNKDHYIEVRGPQLAKRVTEVDAVMACIRDPTKAALIRVMDTSLRSNGQLPDAEGRFKSVLRLMDPTKVVMAGHSFGAATAALATKRNHGFLALIIFDIWSHPLSNSLLDEDVNMPMLSIISDGFTDNPFTPCTKRLLRGNSSDVEGYVLSGTPHQGFSDTPFFTPVWLAKKTDNIGTSPRKIVREAIADLSADFLKKHVQNPIDVLPVETKEGSSISVETVLNPEASSVSKSWAKVVSSFVFA